MNKCHCKLIIDPFAERGILNGDGITCKKLLVDYSCRHARLEVGFCPCPADVNNILALE